MSEVNNILGDLDERAKALGVYFSDVVKDTRNDGGEYTLILSFYPVQTRSGLATPPYARTADTPEELRRWVESVLSLLEQDIEAITKRVGYNIKLLRGIGGAKIRIHPKNKPLECIYFNYPSKLLDAKKYLVNIALEKDLI